MATQSLRDEIESGFGENLRAERARRGLSQEELANRMVQTGFDYFRQATIWKLESAQQRVKVVEAVGLAEALGLDDWTALVLPPTVYRANAAMRAALTRVQAARADLRAGTAEYLQALDALRPRTRAAIREQLRAAGRYDDAELIDQAETGPAEPPEWIVLLARVECDFPVAQHARAEDDDERIARELHARELVEQAYVHLAAPYTA